MDIIDEIKTLKNRIEELESAIVTILQSTPRISSVCYVNGVPQNINLQSLYGSYSIAYNESLSNISKRVYEKRGKE